MSVLRKDNNEAVVGGSPPESDMFHAAASGARDWLSLTLKKARKPLITDKHGLSVLHIAALHGHLDCMELLLAGGYADVNVSCPHGRRPLHMMLTAQSQPNTHAGLIYLLEHGAHISVFLKDAMWRKDKEQQMKRSKHQHNLRQELLMMTKSRGKCVSVLDLPRLGRSGKAMSSPWTEVVLHLSEELKPGHY
ncbi:ankyrin repeat domain-containing protein 53 isoform X3 [Danio rerio]|uniref:Ankyrin repeat domain-containing protein 53 isoform X3 n=3 Tax=Danio rerio TaxID=7955 RepID=A0AC58G334_DANRE|nr:ankyrin repeat domain-containing protein 53 isoform X2 [Danio rerio]|eukprot:XP_009301209.1 ankyrin repeat domain-containing protein 53 isoform X2 [Danio rerio]